MYAVSCEMLDVTKKTGFFYCRAEFLDITKIVALDVCKGIIRK